MKRNAIFASLCLLAAAGMACTFSLFQVPTVPALSTQLPPEVVPAATLLPKAQTVFTVALPEPLQPGEKVAIGLLDEVTGLAFNPQLYPMQPIDATNYTATMALPYNAIVKYHYVRMSSTQVMEDSALDEPVRYRLYYVGGQAEVKDIIGSWNDRSYSRPLGSIQGRVLNVDTGAAIPDARITVINKQTGSTHQARTSSGGFYSVAAEPGENTVKIESPGFQTTQYSRQLPAGRATSINARLNVGSVTQTVEISGNDDEANETNAAFGRRISGIRVTGIEIERQDDPELDELLDALDL